MYFWTRNFISNEEKIQFKKLVKNKEILIHQKSVHDEFIK